MLPQFRVSLLSEALVITRYLQKQKPVLNVEAFKFNLVNGPQSDGLRGAADEEMEGCKIYPDDVDMKVQG